MKIIDCQNQILGRLASYAAKEALLGEEVVLVNCGKAVITGSKNLLIDQMDKKFSRGHPYKGPFISRRPDFFVKKTIQGMLPRKKTRGREALKKIKCFVDFPPQFKEKDLIKIPKISTEKLPNFKFKYLEELLPRQRTKTK